MARITPTTLTNPMCLKTLRMVMMTMSIVTNTMMIMMTMRMTVMTSLLRMSMVICFTMMTLLNMTGSTSNGCERRRAQNMTGKRFIGSEDICHCYSNAVVRAKVLVHKL